MRWLGKARLRFRSLFQQRTAERDLDDELRFHLDHTIEQNLVRGMTREEARRQALIELGGAEQVKQECRDVRGWNFLEDTWRDVYFGVRMLRKSPGFTLVAVLTLALGIGANAAIFSVVESVLLRPLPFKNADRLVDLTEYRPGAVDRGGVSFPDYLVWRQQNTVFEETAAYFLVNASNDVVLGGPFSTVRARYSTVTNSFFQILGVQPALGHGFSAGDEIPGGGKVFLVSNAVWRGVFGGDPRAIGNAYLLDGESYTLIGVMPPGFDFPKGCGIWVPTSTLGESGLHDRISHAFHVMGRLRPGTSVAQAEAQIGTVQERLATTYPKTDADWHVRAQPLLDEIVGNVRTSLLVLLGAVGFILLIACVNVVNLLLSRALGREKEFAIRSALGAGRMRLLRQQLTEVFLIVAISILLALPLARWGLALAVSLTSAHLPRMESFRLNVSVLGFLLAVAALTTILVGLMPALQASRHNPQAALGESQYSGGNGRRSRRILGALVVSEVALTLLLLCGAGLMLQSFVRLIRVNPGFRPEHLLTMKIALPGSAYPKSEQTSAYLDRLLARLRALPGVQSAAAATTLPLSGESDWGTFLIAGGSTPDWANASAASWRGVSVDYFRTLGVPLLRGREFTRADVKNQNAIIINEAMARKFWPAADPIGQRVLIGHRPSPLEIIGIVGDARGVGLNAEPKPEMYTALRGFWYAFLVLRTNREPSSMASTVRDQVASLDKGVPVYRIATMDRLLSRSVAPDRFNLFLLGLFAALALVLATVGIYGVLAFGVGRRTHEIGIRLAMGAHQDDILQLVVRQGMKLVLVGIVLGIAGALALTRLMASLLYGVSATDPATFIAVTFLLVSVAMMACYVPARRAMRVDPVVALRHE
jgi:predicted permease